MLGRKIKEEGRWGVLGWELFTFLFPWSEEDFLEDDMRSVRVSGGRGREQNLKAGILKKKITISVIQSGLSA